METDLVRGWMSEPVVTIQPERALFEALMVLLEHGIRHLLVTDAEGRLLGVLSDRDVYRVLPLYGELKSGMVEELSQRTVAEAMTTKPIVVHPLTPMDDAAEELFQNHIGSLPVTDGDDRLVGVLTTTDVVRAFMHRVRHVRHATTI